MQWSLILLGLGATTAAAGVMRHRFAVSNWLQASFRMAQIVAHHAARTGPAIKKGHSTGEVVATVSNDAMRAGGAFDITARLAGAFVSYIVVAIILLSSSVVARARRPARRARARAADGLRDQAAPDASGRAARGGRQADRARRRHRRGPARAARNRRRAGVLRPLPHPLAGGAPGRRSRRAPPVHARRRPGVHPRALRRPRHVARRALRARGEDRHGRARRLLRVRGVPRAPAADGGRGGRQADALVRRRDAHARDPRGRVRDRRAGESRARARGPASRSTITARGSASSRGA